MTQNIRLAIAQINPTVGALESNRDKIIGYTGKARAHGADIVVFPELALSGYPPEDLLLKPNFIKKNREFLDSLKKHTSDIIAVIGFADMGASRDVYNAAAVMCNGSLAGVYRKDRLPNYAVFDEKRYFTPGGENIVFKSSGIIFGVNICEDIWMKDGPYRAQVASGAGLLINISASPYYAGRGAERRKFLSSIAKKSKVFVCYANLVGGQDELVFDGNSLVIGPDGKTLVSAGEFEEDLVLADIAVKCAAGGKRAWRNKGVKKTNILCGRKKLPKPPLSAVSHPRSGHTEEVYKALLLGTSDYVRKNGFSRTVVGLSGGIDSALTAAIAADALGEENVVGISMPSEYSSRETMADAKKVADNLGIEFLEVPINGIFDVYREVLDRVLAGGGSITRENLQARIRGNILMAFSNENGWLVLTTGNKSETAVGYCTLYGDMAGGFAVIKDVPKTLVYKLADFVNKKKGKDVIPVSTINRAPSAELAPGQKDTDSLPAYDALDPVLKAYVEEDRSYREMRSGGMDQEILRKVINMVDKSEYKRRQAPPGIRITPKAFGKDRRLPITNGYRESGR